MINEDKVHLILREFSTEELVRELETREGVETKYAEPYETRHVAVNGSAIILIVYD